MPRKMTAEPQWLRAGVVGRPVGVDRKAQVLRGYVVAQEGPFKSDGRGEFDLASLQKIVELGSTPGGLKSRFTHPDMSGDGLGSFLGRSRNLTLSTATTAAGATVTTVRADLHFDPTAFDTPKGNLAKYVMDLAESDPDALSSSLVLQTDKEYRVNSADGTRLCDPDGDELPPLWRPVAIHAADIVDTGDAVDGLLSAGVDADDLPLAALWRGAELLDSVFAGQPRAAVEARCLAWMGRYLDRRYGESPTGGPTDPLRRRLRLREQYGFRHC